MKKIIVANWKMNGGFEEADIWVKSFGSLSLQNKDKLKELEIVLCPPSIMIDYIDSELMEDGFKKLDLLMQYQNKDITQYTDDELTKIIFNERLVSLGAQDCHFEDAGSFTGDISAKMLKKVGCEYIIVGHSERRVGHFETSEIIAKKAKTAIVQELVPIICVGESKEIRDQNKHLEFIYKQVMHSIPADIKFEKMIVAYEPIWSIGTGIVPSIEQISEVAKLIKKIFVEKFHDMADEYHVLYGGSVNSENSKEILSIPYINGLLVGKASLDADEFYAICSSAF